MRKLICVFLLFISLSALCQDIETNYPSKLSYGISAGYCIGTKILGTTQYHDVILSEYKVSYDWKERWQPIAKISEGYQCEPSHRNISSLNVGIKYNWYKYNNLTYYIQPEAGLAYTDISHPDLNGAFQFELGARLGAQYAIKKNAALFMEIGWMHLSNASTSNPNKGVNMIPIVAGIEWKF